MKLIDNILEFDEYWFQVIETKRIIKIKAKNIQAAEKTYLMLNGCCSWKTKIIKVIKGVKNEQKGSYGKYTCI